MTTWRAVKALVHDAVDATTHLVGEGHASVARNVRRVSDRIEPLASPVAAVDEVRGLATEGVLAAIRWTNRAVEGLTDAGLAALGDPVRVEATPIPLRSDLLGDRRLTGDAALGFLNGLVGNHLGRAHEALDLGLTLRHGDRILGPPPADATGRVVVLVHGLSTTEWSWCLQAEDWWGDPSTNFGTLLAADLGYTPIFVRYNTGRPVPESGRRLSAALDELLAAWPVPIDEVVLLGHSMGGLVSRSACNAAKRAGHPWIGQLRRVITLGTPHQGAPLAWLTDIAAEMLAAVDLPATRIVSNILDVRSAGIRDLSHGEAGDEGEDPLIEGVAWHFISGGIAIDRDHPVGRWVGDLLVREGSATGPDVRQRPIERDAARFGGLLHHQLQCHPDVYAQVRAACARRAD